MTFCKVQDCPYIHKGLCDRMTVIDANGMCTQLWRNGMRQEHAFTPIDEVYRRRPIVIDVEAEELITKPQEEYHQITIEELILSQEQNES